MTGEARPQEFKSAYWFDYISIKTRVPPSFQMATVRLNRDYLI